MTDLGDILGDDFEQEYNQTARKRQEATRKVDEDSLKEICWKAIEGGGFKGEEPRFTYRGDADVDHDVLLMESPRQDIQKFRHSFENGGMSLGMFHLGKLINLAFNDDLVDLVDKIREDEYYLVVGRYQEKTETDGSGDVQTYYNISPVRGILPLAKAKEFAEKFDEDKDGTTVDQQKQEQTGSSGDDIDLSDTEEDSSVSDDDIKRVLQAIAGNNEDVIRSVAQGDMDHLDRVVNTVNNNVDGDASQDDVVRVFEQEVGEIDWPEEEEEEDDDIDLGGLGGGDDEGESSGDEMEEQSVDADPEPEPATTSDTSSDGGDEEEEEEASADDWF